MKESFFSGISPKDHAPNPNRDARKDKPVIHETPHLKETTGRKSLLEQQKITPRDTNRPENPERRKFFKLMLGGAAALAVASIAAKPAYEVAEKLLDYLASHDESQPNPEQAKDDDAVASALDKIKKDCKMEQKHIQTIP